ncbi:MAG: RsiV family protein [Treponema sp.]|jgi:hypothetical protein|nr:RsiV family protein [Treponema sp.]
MKRVYLFTLVLAFAAAACTPKPLPNDPVLEQGYRDLFESVSFRETVPSDRGSMEFAVELLDVRDGGPLRDLARELLYDKASADEYAKGVLAAMRNEFEAFLAGVEELETVNGLWSFEEANTVEVTANYAVLGKSAYSFTGGAHGNYYALAFVIDLRGPERLNLQALFEKPGLEALIDRELRRVSQEQSGEELPAKAPLSSGIFFEDTCAPPENFFPDDAGINFQWNPYEIAPYSAGKIVVNVPWDDLDRLLSSKGKELKAAYRK